MIPEWMKEVETGPVPEAIPRGRGKGFIGKTVDGVLSFFREAIVAEAFAARPGLLQGLDPRVKLVSTLALVLALSLTGDFRILVAVYLLELVLSYLSRVELFFFIKRVWLFIPLFTGVIALPMIFNVFLPGDPLITIIQLGPSARIGPFDLPESIYITEQGVKAASIFTLRVAVSVSAIVLLFLTTRQQILFKSLSSVGVPKIYILTMEMAYRYIFLLMDLIADIHIAKRARTIAPGSTIDDQKWVGNRIGYVLMRSLDTSEKVHSAMISRGFSGEPRTLDEMKLGRRDMIAGAAALSFCLALLLISQNIIRV